MRTFIVTGSTSAVGAAISVALAEKGGARLVLQFHANDESAETLAARLDMMDAAYSFYRTDLTRPQNAGALVEHALSCFDKLHGLINVVGPFRYKSILEMTSAEWLADIDLNLNCGFHTCRHAFAALRESRGHIVNFAFAGVDNIKPWPMSAGYAAAKTGIAVLTKSLAVALAPEGVRVNAICPGLVDDEAIAAAERQHMASQIPFGRPVKPEEIGKTVAWLLYDSPEMITGALIPIAGAWEY